MRCVSYYVAQIICHTQTKAHMSKPRVCDVTTHSGTFGRLHTSRHTYTHTSLTPLLSHLQISVLASVLTYQSTAWVYKLNLFEFSSYFMHNKERLLLGFRRSGRWVLRTVLPFRAWSSFICGVIHLPTPTSWITLLELVYEMLVERDSRRIETERRDVCDPQLSPPLVIIPQVQILVWQG